MIPIDYVPGSHGHFLSFVCNRFLTDLPREIIGDSPLTATGTSHDTIPTYWNSRYFRESHYYLERDFVGAVDSEAGLQQWKGPVIQIWFGHDDLLVLTATCFLRAGDFEIDVDHLHHDTYHKLNTEQYRCVLQELQRLSEENLRLAIAAVRDATWPQVHTWQHWDDLPSDIKHECLTQHQLHIWRLDQNHPHCPRQVLREYFQKSFHKNSRNGFISLRDQMIYLPECQIYRWQFRDFFDTERFMSALRDLSLWLGLPMRDHDAAVALHHDFLSRHRYRHMYDRCHQILVDWHQGKNHSLRDLNLLEQAWVESQIEQITGCNLQQNRVEFWDDFDEIRNALVCSQIST
jgi:hypothetical protein